MTIRQIAAVRRAVVLDPMNQRSHIHLGQGLYFERHNNEAIAAFQDALALNPEDPATYGFQGLA